MAKKWPVTVFMGGVYQIIYGKILIFISDLAVLLDENLYKIEIYV